jgi:NDP-sugar pyrophosphorylase family protein
MNTIVIVGGGQGTRLKSILGHGCKLLAFFNGSPWIQTAINILNGSSALCNLIININKEHLNDFKSCDIKGNFILNIESSRNGFGFPLHFALNSYALEGSIVLLLGDILFDSSFLNALDQCFILLEDNKIDFITLTRAPRSSSVDDYDVLELNKGAYRVIPVKNLVGNKSNVNQLGGCLIIKKKSLLPFMSDLNNFNFGFRDLHNFLFDKNLKAIEFIYHGYFEDFGTPERYNEVTKHANNF